MPRVHLHVNGLSHMGGICRVQHLGAPVRHCQVDPVNQDLLHVTTIFKYVDLHKTLHLNM